MGVIEYIRELFGGREGRTGATGTSGAYWCDDCGVRLAETEVTDEVPTCPDCGEEMRFERSIQGGM